MKTIRSERKKTFLRINKWPGGRREILCLRCERPFRSSSKATRLCEPCRDPERIIVEALKNKHVP